MRQNAGTPSAVASDVVRQPGPRLFPLKGFLIDSARISAEHLRNPEVQRLFRQGVVDCQRAAQDLPGHARSLVEQHYEGMKHKRQLMRALRDQACALNA